MTINDRINLNIIDANVKLQDENKIIKMDNQMLQKRIDYAAEHLKSKSKKFKAYNLDKYIQDAIDMLEGNYNFEEYWRKK